MASGLRDAVDNSAVVCCAIDACVMRGFSGSVRVLFGRFPGSVRHFFGSCAGYFTEDDIRMSNGFQGIFDSLEKMLLSPFAFHSILRSDHGTAPKPTHISRDPTEILCEKCQIQIFISTLHENLKKDRWCRARCRRDEISKIAEEDECSGKRRSHCSPLL